MDILLISGLDFTANNGAEYQIGQGILHRIVSAKYESKMINFDALHHSGELPHRETIEETLEIMADYLASFAPRIAGFYTICNSFITVVELAGRLHERCPETRIVFGGPHASVTAEACLNAFPYLDAVCRGESEHTFLPFVTALLEGKDLSGISGVSFRGPEGIIETPAAPLLREEELGRYTVYERLPEHGNIIQDISLEGGRGCPYSCTFCSTSSFWERHFRIKPVDTLIAEMDRFHELYQTTKFSIQHDIFTARRSHLEEFCRKLTEKGSPYIWRCSSRVDVLGEEIIPVMYRAGCRDIYLGVETGSPRMQKILKKNLKLDEACMRVSELVRTGIHTTVSFIYGFSEETEEDLRQTLQLMEKMYLLGCRNVQLHRFFPLPRTEEAEKVKERLYFDENDVDLSIYNRLVINEEGKQLIRDYPELFMQYYTFDSYNRKTYPFIEGVALMISFAAEGFYRSCCYVLRKLGMEKLYFLEEDLFRRIYYEFSDVAAAPRTREVMSRYFLEIAKRLRDPLLDEVIRFESDLYEYALGGAKDPITKTYRVDLYRMQHMGEFAEGETEILVWRDSGTGRLRTMILPREGLSLQRREIGKNGCGCEGV